MKAYVAIGKSLDGLRMKFADFDLEADADAYALANAAQEYFVIPNPGGKPRFWIIDYVLKTVDANVAAMTAESVSGQHERLKTLFLKEGVKRIAVEIPDLDTADAVKAYAASWAANPPPSPTAAQTKGKNIYLYVKNTAIPKVNGISNPSTLEAIDVTVNDPFGDGTVWP